MRRLLLLVVCAVVCLGVMATPALGARSVAEYRPPEDIPTLMAMTPGFWWEYHEATGDPNTDLLFWQAYDVPPSDDPEDPGLADIWKPIPVDTPIVTTFGWVATTYGMVRNAPNQIAVTIDVTGPDGYAEHYSSAEVLSCWTGPHAIDEWWTGFMGGEWPLFNPSIRAGVYLNRVLLPLGPFPTEGWYHFSLDSVGLLPAVDLSDWGEHKAHQLLPEYNTFTNEFDFYVE